MDNKRKRPYLERAGKERRDDSEALYLDPKLWNKLPPEVANKVLSYVPIHRLIETLLRVDRRWAKLLRSPAFGQMFCHGTNLNSSYGIVMLEDPMVPRLMGFEQESQRWLSFPKILHDEMKKAPLIFRLGSRDGLMLCESATCKFSGRLRVSCNCPQSDRMHHTEIGVWNPLLCSFKWLSETPHFMNNPDPYSNYHTHYAMMVHEPSRTYRVFLLLFYHRLKKFYSVYDSTTSCWRTSKRMPDFQGGERETWRRVASCDRYIFLHSFQYSSISSFGYEHVLEHYIYWYDADKDIWDRVSLSEILKELGFKAEILKNPPSVENFVILNGVLYMLIRMVHTNEERSGSRVVEGQDVWFLASTDLSALEVVEFGAPSSTRFKFEAFVPDEFCVRKCREQIPLARWARFNMYCYTMKGKGYIGLQNSKSGQFLYYNVSKGDWSKHYQSLEVQGKNWNTGQLFFHFKPSLVVP